MKMTIRRSSGNLIHLAATILFGAGWLDAAIAGEPSQSAGAAPARPASVASMLAVIDERRAITREILELTKSGTTPELITAWQAKNAARLQRSQQKLVEMSARTNSTPEPYISEIYIPPGASKTMEAFLMERTKLRNERILLQNQTMQASPEKRGEAFAAWQKQNAAAREAQSSRAAQIAAESPLPALRVPTATDIPRDATPELRDFLNRRNALIKAENEVTARLKTATPELRQQALEEWRAGNPLPVRAVQETALRLSNESKISN